MNGTQKAAGQIQTGPNRHWFAHGGMSAIVTATIIGLLYFGREVLIPFALAMLLSFLLAPLAERLQHWGMNRVVAVISTAIVSFALMGAVLTVVTFQVVDVVQQFPRYEENLRSKIQTLRGPFGTSIQKTSQTVDDLTAELQRSTGRRTASRIAKVQIVEPSDPMHVARQMLGSLLKPLGAAIVVVVFVIFMLLERADLRDRLIRLLGAQDLYTATQALDDAAKRVTRYLLMQTILNGVQGIALAVGLYFIGVPNAVLWGTIAIALRFIPFIGAWISASLPIAMSFAVFDDWVHPLMTLGLYAGLELVAANIVEPLIYGTGTGVSSLALLVAAAFWTWLWGVPGLLLAVPLTVCLFVAGKYVPQLRFLTIMLGDRPVFDPHERLYQRLLADRLEDAEELLHGALKDASVLEVLDQIFIPAMQLMESDHARAALTADRHQMILGLLRELAADMHTEKLKLEPAPGQPARRRMNCRILCIPAADQADELVARLLADELGDSGADTQVSIATSLAGEVLEIATQFAPRLICISALPPGAAIHARYLCKKMREHFPETTLLVGLWNAQGDVQKTKERLHSCGASIVVTNLADALQFATRTMASMATVERRIDRADSAPVKPTVALTSRPMAKML